MRKPNSLVIEPLEPRSLLSAGIVESEPNDGPSEANPVPRVLGGSAHVTGALGAPGDQDWFRIDLMAGDVIGASLRGALGLDGMLSFGKTGPLIFNDDGHLNDALIPDGSPLPRNADDILDPAIYYVVSEPGTYYLLLSAYVDPDTGETSTGAYDLEVGVHRPGMEAQPVGAKQVLFLDFDGGVVQFRGGYAPPIQPLLTSLSQWGLGAADLNKVVRETVKRTTDKLSTFIAANGLNGDYSRSHRPGEFGIEIRNSLEHADPGGDPLASKIVVGLTDDQQLATEYVALAQHIDVGNFVQSDEGVVSTNLIAGLLRDFPIAKPGNRSLVIDFVSEYMSVLVAHEFGHLAGAPHTQFTFENSFSEPVNLMDKDIRVPMGADLVFGTSDDVVMQFGVDEYDPHELYRGVNDTLNTLAFGLSTGKGAAASTIATAPTASADVTDLASTATPVAVASPSTAKRPVGHEAPAARGSFSFGRIELRASGDLLDGILSLDADEGEEERPFA
jgi:hypothetical protein